ncbi:MAG: iron ABC transporter permease [Desulfobacteraceae bacterium]|nr:iron ABC transporter permease [Desulfobacteraceae bacterium]
MKTDKVIYTVLWGLLIYLIAVFIIFPVIHTLWQTLQADGPGISFDSYRRFFAMSVNTLALKNTLRVGAATVICCMAVGVFMAFFTHYFKTRFARIIHIILLSAFVLPGVIIVIAFIQLYSETGIISQFLKMIFSLDEVPFRFAGFPGILFVHTFTQYVFFYINTTIAIASLDYSLIESARSFGASRCRVFFDIIFPHIKPAILTSSLMTFAIAVSSFSAPYLVGRGYRMMSTQILQSKMNNQMTMAATQVMILMLISMATMMVYSYYNRKQFRSDTSKIKTFRRVSIESRPMKILIHVTAYLILFFIIIPVIGIIGLSFADASSWMLEIFPRRFSMDNYIKVFSQGRIFAPVKNSLFMALTAAGFATVMAVITSTLILKYHNFQSRLLNFFLMLPMAIPASTLGILMITTFNEKRLILFNHSLVGTYGILVVAYIILSITIVSRSTYTAFSNFNKEHEFASKGLGANGIQTFYRIFLPIVRPGIISGFALCFMRSLGEYTVSALLYGVHNRPVSIAMVNALHDFDAGISMTYGVIIIAMGVAFLALINMKHKSIQVQT